MKNTKVQVVAEIGWNFMGDIDLAEEMIKQAKNCGADICKFQLWDPKYLKKGVWDEDGRLEIYEKAKLTDEKINKLQEICNKNEIEFLVSIFSKAGAERLNGLGCKSVKIPSHESSNFELHEYCYTKFEKIYLSLGACTKKELDKVIYMSTKAAEKINAMHCVSAYPCEDKNLNMPRLNYLKENFENIGFSDHSDSLISGAVAVAMGCTLIEKHFTTDNSLPGRDNKFAHNPEKFSSYVKNIKDAENMMINHGVSFQEIEKDIVENYRGRWDGDIR